jgi:type I restriction enzyme S subunit
MSKYRRYERYKDSGVEWIGEIPEEWNLSKIKYEALINKNVLSEKTESDYEINYVDIGSVNSTGEITDLQNYQFENAPSRARRAVSIGDTIVSTVRTYLNAIAFIEEVNSNLICSTGFAVLTPGKRLHRKYLFYLMRSDRFVNEIVKRSTGVSYPAVNASDVGNLECLLPDMQSQVTIVDFLDQKTTEIDDLIAEKEKLIELLQEKRQAIISEAVTKGLNPNVRMKDSGVDWIGDIPEHWDIRRIKYLSNIRNVKASDGDNDKTYVGLESIESKTGKLLTNNNDEQQAVGETANIFKKGDVLFGKLRPYLAKCIVADFNGRCTSELLVLRTASNMLPEYLYLFMLSPIFIDVVNSSTYGAKMPRASWDFIGNLKVPLPNIKEQEEIVEYLIKLTNNMDDLISDISTQIQKLKEYRQSLISEAVTGKVDVRELENVSEVIYE